MSDSIGKHIQKWLRFKEISNREAGEAIGLSKSAFEKVLAKDDILIGRLLKLISLTNENLLEFYHDKEPLKSFREKELKEWTENIEALNREISDKNKLLETSDQLLSTQQKYIAELEDKIARLEGENRVRN